jgi:pimeloyl-ACP methyl ester carboxylesterase
MSATLLLLHAFPLDHRMWAEQERAATEAGWRVIAPDLPGFGGTGLLPSEPGLDAVAANLLDRLAEDGVDHAVVAGLSLGGYVAMAMIRMATMRGCPEFVDAVMLCDTKASADGPEAVRNRMRLAEAVTADPVDSGRILRQAILPGLLGQTTHATRPEVVAVVGGWLDAARPETVAWYQRAMAARPDSHGTLRSLQAPALVLWGSEDSLSPQAEQSSMLDALNHGQEAIIDGVGHLSAVEDPAAVSEGMLSFLSRCAGQPSMKGTRTMS